MTLRQEFSALRDKLSQRHIERYDEVEMAFVAILCGYHAVLIGPPGTAKSMMSADFVNAFDGATRFKYLFTKFTTPEEIFGPWDLSLLKEGQYRRITRGMAPEAHIIFEDEIFKANSAILNAQLTLMNERQFDNGGERIDCPLITVFGASNELPEGEELWALFDRFHLRKVVNYIHEPGNFVRMLQADNKPIESTLTLDDLLEAQQEVRTISIPTDVWDTMVEIRSDMQLEGLIASDRRYRQAILALKAMAWLHDRDHVTDDDFRILEHMLWTNPEDVKKVSRIVLAHTNPLDQEANEIIDLADEIAGQLTTALLDAKSRGVDVDQALTKQGIEWFTRCKKLSERIKKLEQKALKQGRPTNRIEMAKDRVVRVAKEVGRHTIGLEDMQITRD